jgi:hypothetical protein
LLNTPIFKSSLHLLILYFLKLFAFVKSSFTLIEIYNSSTFSWNHDITGESSIFLWVSCLCGFTRTR